MKKKILLVSHQLDFSGAPLALLEMAKSSISLGYEVFLISLRPDAGLANEFKKVGVTVLNKANINEYNYIVFNTVLSTRAIPTNSGLKEKLILWIHESPYLQGLGWSKSVRMQNAAYVNKIIFPTFACHNEWKKFITINDYSILPSPVEIPVHIQLEKKQNCKSKPEYCIIDPREDYRGISRIEESIQNYKGDAVFHFVGSNPPSDQSYPNSVQVHYYGRIGREQTISILNRSDYYISATCMATQNRGLCEAIKLKKYCIISEIDAHVEIIEKSRYKNYKFFKPLDHLDLNKIQCNDNRRNPLELSANFLNTSNFIDELIKLFM